ncbi:MAG: hypothetical protein GY853_14670 [PVC group bacterium]|nr:hypothetical protein [PVC group bacterium]
MDRKDAKNCWEYWDCPEEAKKECPSYHADKGNECWLLGAAYCAEHCPFDKQHRGILGCIHCPWYKKFEPYPR